MYIDQYNIDGDGIKKKLRKRMHFPAYSVVDFVGIFATQLGKQSLKCWILTFSRNWRRREADTCVVEISIAISFYQKKFTPHILNDEICENTKNCFGVAFFARNSFESFFQQTLLLKKNLVFRCFRKFSRSTELRDLYSKVVGLLRILSHVESIFEFVACTT